MSFSIRIKGKVLKELAAIVKPDRLRIVSAIDALVENPYKGSVLKGDLTGLRRIRVGRYRVIYEIDQGVLQILVVKVGHRREVYR